MNVTVYLGWITLLLVGGVLAVSAYGVMADALTLKEFLAQWMPIATLISAVIANHSSVWPASLAALLTCRSWVIETMIAVRTSGTTTTFNPTGTLTLNGTIADDSTASLPTGQGYTGGAGTGAYTALRAIADNSDAPYLCLHTGDGQRFFGRQHRARGGLGPAPLAPRLEQLAQVDLARAGHQRRLVAGGGDLAVDLDDLGVGRGDRREALALAF